MKNEHVWQHEHKHEKQKTTNKFDNMKRYVKSRNPIEKENEKNKKNTEIQMEKKWKKWTSKSTWKNVNKTMKTIEQNDI
jgi:hypothetical protein